MGNDKARHGLNSSPLPKGTSCLLFTEQHHFDGVALHNTSISLVPSLYIIRLHLVLVVHHYRDGIRG